MTNREFLNMLLISGNITKEDLYNDENKYKIHVQNIINSKEFISDNYKKFMKLSDIQVKDILFMIGILVVGFNFNEKETAILLKRIELIKRCTNLKYDMQAIQIYKNLIEGKGIITELYKCNLFTGLMTEIYLYDLESGMEVYKLVKEKDRLLVFNSYNNKLIANDTKYILITEKGFKIVDNSGYDRNTYLRDRYKFKIS